MNNSTTEGEVDHIVYAKLDIRADAAVFCEF
jgi:hypothetical protein